MATCDYCGATIIFGGVRDHNLRFCNKNCRQKGQALVLANEIPDDIVDQRTREMHQGACPICKGVGPVDVRNSYIVFSIIIFTFWKNIQIVGCRSCGIKRSIIYMILSLIFGWWGFPFGLIMTPIIVIRNLISIFKVPDETKPSEKLKKIVRINIYNQRKEQSIAQSA
jgi:hypothetical protein